MDLEWKSLIITRIPEPSDEVFNQIFYSDKCDWISSNAMNAGLIMQLMVFKEAGIDRDIASALMAKGAKDVRNVLEGSHSEHFTNLFKICKPYLHTKFNDYQISNLIMDYLIHLRFNMVMTKYDFEMGFFNKLRPNFSSFEDAVDEIAVEYNVIVDSNQSSAKHWSPYKAVDTLQKALIKTQKLTDISSLKLDQIFELKDKLKSDFQPFRAELLTMAESLMLMVKGEESEKNISREAANLIITRVEPVLRNYKARIDSELKDNTRFKKYFKKTGRVIGFAGLGHFFPAAFAWAMKDSVDLVSDALSENTDIKPATETARFAIKMDSFKKH